MMMMMKTVTVSASSNVPPPSPPTTQQQPSQPKSKPKSKRKSKPKQPSLRRFGGNTREVQVQQQQQQQQQHVTVNDVNAVQFFPLFAGLDHYIVNQLRDTITIIKIGYNKLSIAVNKHRQYRIRERNVFNEKKKKY